MDSIGKHLSSSSSGIPRLGLSRYSLSNRIRRVSLGVDRW